jgi:hypothetical protein
MGLSLPWSTALKVVQKMRGRDRESPLVPGGKGVLEVPRSLSSWLMEAVEEWVHIGQGA